ncbi:MAG: hydantoinase/oxoprolinase family protein, partial [Gemmatimonadetes bacterium]|nr:hydantoinase/oxoprolinase family protein [Gemmatimonadota bacterium]
RQACRQLAGEGVEAVAVCFLHSYANPDHERRAAAIASELLPHAAVSTSHAVAPQMREYERASTTVANAYVKQLAGRYLGNLQEGMRSLGVPAPLHVTLSNGGTATAATAAEFPVRLVESGPCGGALAAAETARRCGFEDLLAFDMGGTTAKAFLSAGGEFPITTESEVARVYRFKRGSGLPLLVPVLDMIEVGAGGGSIARIDPLGLPVVGPESAGSSPGPACYGLGGELPTVTDADLLLGFLDPGFFLGGEMALDTEAAARAVSGFARGLNDKPDGLGGASGAENTAAAWGIHRLVNENMANAARVHAAERGLDVASFAMVATGGAGPVHACKVAELLGIETVIVPGAAGVSSAIGLLLAPLSFDFSQSLVARLADLDLGRVDELLAGLESRGRGIVAAGGVSGDRVEVVRTADMRYVGQGHEIRVPLPGGSLEERSHPALQEAFDNAYSRSYGRICEGVPVEAIHWRVTVSGPRPKLQLGSPGSRGTPLKGEREAFFDGRPQPVPVFDRYALPAGFAETGPLIVEEVESTTVVPPGWSLSSTERGDLLVRRSGSRSA